jgi:hypothetical protein
VVAALRTGTRVLGPVAGDPAWGAALYGSLAAGLVGSLVEDSGPELLVTAVFTGACVLCYVWGRPVRGRPEDPLVLLVPPPSAHEQDHARDHQHHDQHGARDIADFVVL